MDVATSDRNWFDLLFSTEMNTKENRVDPNGVCGSPPLLGRHTRVDCQWPKRNAKVILRV